jgi:hypothetical protein
VRKREKVKKVSEIDGEEGWGGGVNKPNKRKEEE